MKMQRLNPKALSAPRGYTHVVAVEGARKLVYVSGQVSWGPDGAVVGRGDMRAQAEQVFENLTGALRAAGAGWADVVKMTGFMVGMSAENVAAYREVRNRYLKQAELPASTLVGLERLVDPDLVLEVEVVAALGAGKPAKKARKAKKKR
jgi:enamine deaminase RidA (YjgF/YER057c/UK114 family)